MPHLHHLDCKHCNLLATVHVELRAKLGGKNIIVMSPFGYSERSKLRQARGHSWWFLNISLVILLSLVLITGIMLSVSKYL